jgi:hypothetical protein
MLVALLRGLGGAEPAGAPATRAATQQQAGAIVARPRAREDAFAQLEREVAALGEAIAVEKRLIGRLRALLAAAGGEAECGAYRLAIAEGWRTVREARARIAGLEARQARLPPCAGPSAGPSAGCSAGPSAGSSAGSSSSAGAGSSAGPAPCAGSSAGSSA